MIRVYLDWNIISKLKTPEFAEMKSFLTENGTKISIPFSPAHFEDISKSDSPNNTKFMEDITTMDTLCQGNHMAYDKELDIAAPYIVTPSQYYVDYKNNNVSIEEVTNPSYLSSLLAEINHPIVASMLNHFLNTPISFPKWDISTANPTYNIFAKLQDVSTIRELTHEVITIMHRITTDKETYKALRGVIGPKILGRIQEPLYCIVPALNQILMQAGSPMGFMDIVMYILQKQDNCNKMSIFTTAYILLNMLYRPDKLPKKGNNATNVITDAMHAYYGAFCDYFVTDDKKLADKADVLFYEFNINTPIITSKELISTLSPLVWNCQDSKESIIADIIESTKIENRNKEHEICDNDTYISWVVALDKYYFNFFNYANVFIEKNEHDGMMAIHLYRRFKGLSHYVFYSEVEQLLDLLSCIFGEIPETQKDAIKNCQKDESFIWSFTDLSVSILIREDEDYKGRPKLIFIIGNDAKSCAWVKR